MQQQTKRKERHLFSSAAKPPFQFTIDITEQANNHQQWKLSGYNVITNKWQELIYTMEDRTHASYLSLLEALSNVFGLRGPQNRKPAATRNFAVQYQPLITKNLVPEMIYGYGDPAVLRVEEGPHTGYYLVVTSNDAPNAFPICYSTNLVDWRFAGFVFPEGSTPAWAATGEGVSDYWAPEMHRVGNTYRVYFTARHKETLELCIGMAAADNPLGPFIAADTPLLMGNVIDPHLLVENDEEVFLYWKEDNNGVWPNKLLALLHKEPSVIDVLFTELQNQAAAHFAIALWPWMQQLPPMEAFMLQQVFIEAVTSDFAGFQERLVLLATKRTGAAGEDVRAIAAALRTPVYAQLLNADGITLRGEKKQVLANDQPWEAHLVEGSWITKYAGKYYFFYAGNDFSTDLYGIGVAIGHTPTGPFTKMPLPFLQSTNEWWAPGHPSVALTPDGRHCMFLHGFFPGMAGYKVFRALLTVPLQLQPDAVTIGR